MDKIRDLIASLNIIDFFLSFTPVMLFILIPYLIFLISPIIGIIKDTKGRLDKELSSPIETFFIFYLPINILITQALENHLQKWFVISIVVYFFLSAYYCSRFYKQFKLTNWNYIMLILIAYNLHLFIVDFFFLYQGHYKYVYATQVGYQTIAYAGVSSILVIYFVLLIIKTIKSKNASKKPIN